MYEAFNARDIDAVLLQMTEDVDWPNAWEGGRVHGHDGVRDYWIRQWSALRECPSGTGTGTTGTLFRELFGVCRLAQACGRK
jgi:hypothetical protein